MRQQICIVDGKKPCSRCKQHLPVNAFDITVYSKTGLMSRCKSCRHEAAVINNAKYRKQRRKYRKVYDRMRRIDILNHYSNNEPKCICCGEREIDFLALDHIDGGGNKHRREILKKCNMSAWIIKNNYPPIFQILCHNCNMAKGFYGVCPHQKKSLEAVA